MSGILPIGLESKGEGEEGLIWQGERESGLTLLWTPGNQTCFSSFNFAGPFGRSQIVGEKGLRCSSSAKAWKAYSTLFETLVLTKEYSWW